MTINDYTQTFTPTNLQQSNPLERIATGLKLNQASDDSSALAIANNLRVEANAFSQAIQNVNSGVAFTQIGDQAISEQSNILDNIREKLLQASTDTTSDDQRQILREDIQNQLSQFDNIAASTNYNGNTILQNTQDDQSASADFDVQAGTNPGDVITQEGIQANTLGVGLQGLAAETDESFTSATARDYLDDIDSAINTLNGFRSDLGSTQNQLESSFRNLSQAETNTRASEAVLSNVDFAQEVSNFSKQNILAQVGAFSAAQGNNINQQTILRLLT